MVAAWEEQGNNRRIAALDGEGAVPDKMVGGLVREMTGEIMINIPTGELAGLLVDCLASQHGIRKSEGRLFGGRGGYDLSPRRRGIARTNFQGHDYPNFPTMTSCALLITRHLGSRHEKQGT